MIYKENKDSLNRDGKLKCKKRIKIGFLLIGNGNWKGGLNYQKNLLKIISDNLSEKFVAHVFVTNNQYKVAKDAFQDYLEKPLIIDERAAKAGIGMSALKALVIGKDKSIENLFLEHEIDVVFETARFFGRTFSLPCLSWIPDLQHKHLPNFFKTYSWWKREIGFWMQTKFNDRRLILLSSETAQKDCIFFYPNSKNHTHILRFSPKLDLQRIYNHIPEVRAKYDLPDKYFYMPNHFWAHKNHNLVLEAILKLRKQEFLKELPPIIISGPIDIENPDVFNNFVKNIELESLEPWLINLGLIPYDDVLSINAGAIAILNPSKFEGWSSSVEEAKALGTEMILSDIAVHQEQSPFAYFFNTNNPTDLQKILLKISNEHKINKVQYEMLEKASNERIMEFSNCLKSAIINTYSLKNKN